MTIASGQEDAVTKAAPEPSDDGPSDRELVLLVIFSFIVFIAVVLRFRDFSVAVDGFGDSSAYMVIATCIRHWNFQGLVIKQFWGLPYLMAGLSIATHLSDRASLMIISMLASVASVLLTRRLWGGWVAGFFAVINFDWLQRSVLGGSEPLFVALLFGSFLALRKQRWPLAALLASLATIVRPLGIFGLMGIGLCLLRRKEYRKFLVALAIGCAIGSLYAIPFVQYYGGPLANIGSYHSPQWNNGWLFGVPFSAIIKGTLQEPVPWTNLVLSFGWIFLVLAAIVMMWRSDSFRKYARAHPVEIMFAVPYLWCLYSYGYPHWARGNFARFAIPIVPFVLLALHGWIPKDRRVLWTLGLISPALAAASAVGLRLVVHRLMG